MPVFNYKVRDKYGILIKGKLEERTKEALAEYLQNSGYTVLSISEQTEFQKSIENFLKSLKTISKEEIVVFTRQLSGMLAAGLPLLTCLSSLAKQTPNKKFSEIIEDIRKDVEAGIPLSEAMAKHPKIFSNVYVNMVNVGEVSGRLEEVLQRLAELGFQQMEIKSKIINAITYPAVLFTLMTIIMIVMLTYVVPKFVPIFEQAGENLPFFTKALINTSNFIKNYWLFIIIAIAVSLFGIKKYYDTPKGKFNIDKFLLRVPALGSLILNYNIATMSKTLANLLKSGVSLVRCLSVTENTIRNEVIKIIISELRQNVIKGKGIADQLKMSGIFPPMAIQMIAAGEQTGKLDEMLAEIANFYTTEVDYSIKKFTSLLGPLMLLIMALFVGVMAFAILVPIFKMAKLFRQKF